MFEMIGGCLIVAGVATSIVTLGKKMFLVSKYQRKIDKFSKKKEE